MADRVGQRFGNYRLIRLLGQGSFGDVYLGEHIHDTTLAAVKILQARLAHEDLKKFINEASTNFRLKHQHIVQMLDFGIGADDTPYLVMDYAPKGTLRQRYPKGIRLSPETVVSYVKQVAAALQYAHDKRVIHRDVKPENILLGPNNEIWLSDFGIASVAQSTGTLDTDKPGGTIPYMAPEQIQGKPRLASDQYALGIIAYEWLCGIRPFNGTATEIALQHISALPPPLRGKDPTIPLEVEQVVLTALAKDPKDRFVSVSAFATALEQACLPKQSFPSAPPVVPSQPPISSRLHMPKIIVGTPLVLKPPGAAVRIPPDSPGNAIRELSRQYLKVLTKPSIATFTEEMSKATWGSVWLQLIGLATIGGLISFTLSFFTNAGFLAGLIQSLIILIPFTSVVLSSGSITPQQHGLILSLGILFTSIPLIICIFFVKMGITYLFTGIRGQQGKFLAQIYTYLLFWVPLSVIISSLILVAFNFSLGPYPLLIALVLDIYGIVLNIFSIKAVHRLSGGSATEVVLISIIGLFLVLGLGIVIVSIIIR